MSTIPHPADRTFSTDIEDVVAQAQSAAMTTRTAADYSTEELRAEVRRRLGAHWKIKLREDLSTDDLISLLLAYMEDIETE